MKSTGVLEREREKKIKNKTLYSVNSKQALDHFKKKKKSTKRKKKVILSILLKTKKQFIITKFDYYKLFYYSARDALSASC